MRRIPAPASDDESVNTTYCCGIKSSDEPDCPCQPSDMPTDASASPVLVLGGCSQRHVTGDYVFNEGDTGLLALQLVETNDHGVTGRAEVVGVQPDERLEDHSSSITGAEAGGLISMSFLCPGLLEQKVLVSGTLNGSKLLLDGDGRNGLHSTSS